MPTATGIDFTAFFRVRVPLRVPESEKGGTLTTVKAPPPQEKTAPATVYSVTGCYLNPIRIASRRLLIPVVPAVSPSAHGAIQPYVCT